VITRWNSDCIQLKELLVQRNVINRIADTKTTFEKPSKITPSDVELINRLLVVLRPFEYATNLVSFIFVNEY